MTANYVDYQKMMNKLFFGVALTEKHMNKATETIRKYLCDTGAADTVKRLGVGIELIERDGKLIKERFVYVSREAEGRELSVSEIINIGLFLRGGAYA